MTGSPHAILRTTTTITTIIVRNGSARAGAGIVAGRKGYVEPAAIDAIVETYETKVGPRNGAAVVAKAWSDPAFRDWLMRDATAAIASLGFSGRQGEHMVALENIAGEHNLVVCTLCSCYPGRCSDCRRPGINRRPIVRAR